MEKEIHLEEIEEEILPEPIQPKKAEDKTIKDQMKIENEPVNQEPEKEMPLHAPTISEIEFPNLVEQHDSEKIELDAFSNIPINVSVELALINCSVLFVTTV